MSAQAGTTNVQPVAYESPSPLEVTLDCTCSGTSDGRRELFKVVPVSEGFLLLQES